MKKYFAELFGTFVLVFFATGTAVVTGGMNGGTGVGFLNVLAISLSFGLAIVAVAYSVGHISGAHVNPAVSFAFYLLKKLSLTEFLGYVAAQVVGALLGSSLIAFINANSTLSGFGANGYDSLSAVNLSLVGAIVVEIILTFVFVRVILEVTSKEETSTIAGIVIGLTLTFVHLIGIPLTGTSVNPARSLAPAIYSGGTALSQVWVFLLAPMVGAALAVVGYKYICSKN